MKKLITAFVLLVTLVSCTNNNNEKNTNKDLNVTMLSSPAGDSCAEPYLFTDKNGIVYLSWIEKKGKESMLKFSTLSKEQWTPPVTIAAGNNWFVNWADYPVIAADGNNNMLAHYLEKSDTAKFTYDIKLVASADAGKTWSN